MQSLNSNQAFDYIQKKLKLYKITTFRNDIFHNTLKSKKIGKFRQYKKSDLDQYIKTRLNRNPSSNKKKKTLQNTLSIEFEIALPEQYNKKWAEMKVVEMVESFLQTLSVV
jgi:hypothetical protein